MVNFGLPEPFLQLRNSNLIKAKIMEAKNKNAIQFLFRFFDIFGILGSKVFGVWDHRQCIRIKIWSRIQVSMPQIEFSEAISDQIQCFSNIFARSFF